MSMRSLVRGRTAALLAAAAAVTVATACQSSSSCGCRPPPCGCAYPAYGAPAPMPMAMPMPMPAPMPPTAPATGPAPASGAAGSFSAQAARGGVAFARYCASCHGASGEGTAKAPALVGASALPVTRPGAKLRTMEFHTAGDVARFVIPNMPPVGEKPSAEDALAILAFALQANGVARTEPVSVANADSIVIHR